MITSALSSLLLPDTVIEQSISDGPPTVQTAEERLANKQEWWRRLNWQEKCLNAPKKIECRKAIEGRERKFQLATDAAQTDRREGIATDHSTYAKHERDTKSRIRRQKDLILTWAVIPPPKDSDLPAAPSSVKKRRRRFATSDTDGETDTEQSTPKPVLKRHRRRATTSDTEKPTTPKSVSFKKPASESKDEKRDDTDTDGDELAGPEPPSPDDMKVAVQNIGNGMVYDGPGIFCSGCGKGIVKDDRHIKSRNCEHYSHVQCLTRQAATIFSKDHTLRYIDCPADDCASRFWVAVSSSS